MKKLHNKSLSKPPTIWHLLLIVSAVCILCMLSSCSTSRGSYGNQYQDHGWGQERKCGKQKPGKWQRTSSRETDRNGNVQCHTWW